MFSMNVMPWNGGDIEKLKVLQNKGGCLALGSPKWMAVEAMKGDLGWSLFSYKKQYYSIQPLPLGKNGRGCFELEICEQYGKNRWNARCVEEDSSMRYLVGVDEECNTTVVEAVKNFLVHAWNKRHMLNNQFPGLECDYLPSMRAVDHELDRPVMPSLGLFFSMD
ncbi:hypothetical protein FHG87_024587 [Trinorchestia longiramus]|nr:hypothetical protein FHG87_024587 [Trinorchestia longiramus]